MKSKMTALTGQQKKDLKKIYLDISSPASFSGVTRVFQESKRRGLALSKDAVKKWLQEQDVYTLHKPTRKKFKTKKVVVGGLNIQLQADLVDMQKFSRENKGYKYILTVIDCFSRFAHAVPLVDKTGKSITAAFKNHVINDKDTPVKIQVDRGTEFYNQTFKTYLKDLAIQLFSSNSDYKAQMVERLNRTLKSKMWKYFTHNRTEKWVGILEDLVLSYNSSPHSSLPNGLCPKDVNRRNEKQVWWHLYGDYLLRNKSKTKNIFKLGDKVRISKWKRVFQKGYLPNYTEELFEIVAIANGSPTTYTLRDLGGEVIQGQFYQHELSKHFDSGIYNIEKIVMKRKRGGRMQAFVKWLGYPEEMNSWIDVQGIVHSEMVNS